MVATSQRSQLPVVLVIDPDPDIQRDMRDRLVALGYSARSVDDYESALGVVTATPPDLVLLTGNSTRSEAWDGLQTELSRWGIPMLDLGSTDASSLSTSPLPDDPAFLPVLPIIEDSDLKL